MPLSSGGSRYLCRGLALGRAYGVNLSELRFLSAIYTDEELDAPLFYRHYRCQPHHRSQLFQGRGDLDWKDETCLRALVLLQKQWDVRNKIIDWKRAMTGQEIAHSVLLLTSEVGKESIHQTCRPQDANVSPLQGQYGKGCNYGLRVN